MGARHWSRRFSAAEAIAVPGSGISVFRPCIPQPNIPQPYIPQPYISQPYIPRLCIPKPCIPTPCAPRRCGILPFVFDEDFGFARYAEFALDVPMYFVYR